MEHEVLRKLRSATAKAGHDALVAFSQDNVTYTAGFLLPSHASNRFRRTITVLAGDQFAAQIVVNVEENLAKQRSRFSDIRRIISFRRMPRTCSPMCCWKQESERVKSLSNSITCPRRITSGCASGCPAQNSSHAANFISTRA